MRTRAQVTLAVWLLFAWCALAARSEAVPFYRFPIILTPYEQVNPHLSGETVVWTEEDGLNGYDLRMGRYLPFATGIQTTIPVQLSGSRMMWSGPGFSEPWWQKFWGNHFIYDFATGREFPIANLIGMANPSFANNIVVGMTHRPTADIYGVDITTGRIFNVCSAPKYQGFPVTDGQTVVWMDYRNDPEAEDNGLDPGRSAGLYGFDLTTRTEFPILTTGQKLPNYFRYNVGPAFLHPDVSGDYVVWMDYRTGSATAADVYGLRISTGAEFKMNTAGYFNVFPQVSGRMAVWGNSPLADIFGYDLVTDEPLTISNSSTPESSPDISGNNIVWTDLSNDWFPYDSDTWGARVDYGFAPPQGAHDPTAFQPYIAYLATHPTNPAMGEPYTLVAVVRNHGGRSGTATVSLTETKVTQAGDAGQAMRSSDSRPLGPYGEATLEFRGFRHAWRWSPTPYQELMQQAGSLITADTFRRYAEVTFGDGRDRVMNDILHDLGSLVAPEAVYRYDVLLEPASQMLYTTARVQVPRYQKAALVNAIASSLNASLLAYGGWADPEASAMGADEAIWHWLSREFHRVALLEGVYPAGPATDDPPAYPELAALPESPAKTAALASLRYSGPASALAYTLRQMALARDRGMQDDDISKGAEYARNFAESAQGEICMVQRTHGLSPFSAARAGDLAAFRASLRSDGLPSISTSFLLARGWTEAEVAALAASIAALPDSCFSIPRVTVDAPIVVEGTVRTAVEETTRVMYDVMPTDGSADTIVVLVGIPTRDGKYIGSMQVRLNYLREPGAAQPREYSLDGGHTWEVYGGPVTIPGSAPAWIDTRRTLDLADQGVSRRILKRDPIFSDVPPSYWAARNIESAYFSGIVSGYADGRFLPELVVTRDQVAVYLARLSTGGDGFVPTGPAVASFPDVPPTHWAYDYIEYVKKLGIVKGYGDGLYHPERTVNRADMAIFTARTLAGSDEAIPAPSGDLSFPDVPASAGACKYIEYLWRKGVVIGYADGLYHPEYLVKRDQLSVFIQRGFGLPLQGE